MASPTLSVALYIICVVITHSATREVWSPATEADRQAVLDELCRILDSPGFRSSRRYPAFLRFVVEKTVVGAVDHLKERTLGIEVFKRSPDYDTSTDPIVRFTAGEVRKRIAQYYTSGVDHGEVEIALPVGSYVPRFYRRVEREAPDIAAASVTIPFAGAPPDDELEALQEPQATSCDNEAHPSPTLVKTQPDSTPLAWLTFGRSRWNAALVTILLLVAGMLAYQRLKVRSPLMQVWAPMLENPDGVLISAGRPHPDGPEMHEPEQTTIREHILRPEFRISLTTMSAISHIVGLLQSQHRRFRIHEAYSNTLTDLHGRPVVLVAGNDNKWTVLLTSSRRFHLVQNGDAAYILDAEHPERRDWKVDFGMPYLQQTLDYAIFARFQDATTGGPVMVVAGISSNGTDAAGEFSVSPEALAGLAKLAPGGRLDQNFEVVLKVEVVGGNTGAVTVVATTFW